MNRIYKLKYIHFSCFLLLITLFSIVPVKALSTLPVPTSYKYINDYTNTLDNLSINNIISIGQELERQTAVQQVVVMINSTEGIPIEDYSNKLFRDWGIGQKEQDNGILILISLNDKAWRVEVGRGLEGAMPDALSSRIMQNYAKPYFVANDYPTGIVNSYKAFAEEIAKSYNVTLSYNNNINNTDTNKPNSKSSVFAILFILLLFLDIFLNRGRLINTLLQLIFISNINNRGPRNGSGGGNSGGFGGGNSNGGGSSGNW